MTDERLIEEAADAIWDAHESGLSRGYLAESRPHYSDSEVYARAALAVFEKAHTATDDERESLITDVEQWNEALTHAMPATETLMARLASYVRRSSDALAAVTAEKELWRVRCAEETIAWADEAAENRRLLSAKPQGEPSDAQVIAALNAWGDDRTATLADWHPEKIDAMRAALRAASEAGGEGR